MGVMGVKEGTKTWKDSGAGSPDLKGEVQQTQLTEAQKKMLGDENIGNVLNKVSDPNYVDSSKQVRGTGSSKMDKDAFFKLMLAQLKNQDPTNPLKNHEMAAQLAQFSTLEQMTNMNTTLSEIKGGNKPIEQFQALNLIGKKVSGDSSKISRADYDNEHEFKFNLPTDTKEANIKVFNQKGEEVREYKFNQLKAGENKISWNGQDERGRKTPTGQYKFQITAIGNDGQKILPKTDFEGVVTGIGFSAEGPVVQVGKQSVRLKDIRQFSDPSLMSNDQKSKDVTQLDLKKTEAQAQNNIKEEERTEAQKKAMEGSVDDVLTQVGMDGNLLNKFKEAMDKQASADKDKSQPKPNEPEVQ